MLFQVLWPVIAGVKTGLCVRTRQEKRSWRFGNWSSTCRIETWFRNDPQSSSRIIVNFDFHKNRLALTVVGTPRFWYMCPCAAIRQDRFLPSPGVTRMRDYEGNMIFRKHSSVGLAYALLVQNYQNWMKLVGSSRRTNGQNLIGVHRKDECRKVLQKARILLSRSCEVTSCQHVG